MKLQVIYEPAGRAREYADLALNIYNGCSFGCKYCFASSVLQRDRNEFHCDVKLRDKLIEKVEQDCMSGLIKKPVHLSFTCDPYQNINQNYRLTRAILELFKQYNINFAVLTKGGLRAAKDFELYKKGDSYGTTLTFMNDVDSLHWEPGAATPALRIATLRIAHLRGIKTWVSLEPVLDPEQALRLIDVTHEFVDLYKIGKLNTNNCRSSEKYEELKKIEQSIDWGDFGRRALALMGKYGKDYYIKKDLGQYMNEKEGEV